MHRSDIKRDNSVLDRYCPRPPGGALGAAEGYVAASTDAGRSCDEGGQKFSATLEALCCWGEKYDLIRPTTDYDFLTRRPDGFGDEHQAWFDEQTGRWFKATYENRFGLAWGRSESANVREYLTRLILQNTYFGDDIQLVALVNSAAKLRILTSQPHIAGEPALYQEIQKWFEFLGFLRIEVEGSVAWYRAEQNLLVADAHEGNVIRVAAAQGATVLVPIDLNLVTPNSSLLTGVRDYVQQILHQGLLNL